MSPQALPSVCCLPYDFARSKPATPRPWSHCTQQLGSTRRPASGPGRACVSNSLYILLCLIPTGPWMSSRLGLYVSSRSVLQESGEHAARGLPGQCLWHSPEDLVFMLVEIQYLVWQTRAGPPSSRHTHSQYLPCAQSLDTCINSEHEHLEVSPTLDFKEPAMVITTQFQGASFRGSWFPSKHALAFVQSCSTWPVL